MSKPNDGGPAFPQFGDSRADKYPPGMSLRDYFAGQALNGVLYGRIQAGLDSGQESIAAECYELADALLKERSKGST